MSIKNKILSRVGLMFIIATAAIITIVSINFREYGIGAAEDKASIIAELVKNGLTAHMVNGTMDSRDTFLDGISRLKDVEALWVVRGDSVSSQYGPPRASEVPRDDIDRLVLKDGEIIEKLDESSTGAKLRVTIPYKATTNEIAKCLDCHDSQVGDILGAISMEFDIKSIRDEGLNTIIKIILTVLVAIFLIIILTNRIINPYLELFESLKNSLSGASKGDFSKSLQSSLQDEAGEMVKCYDQFLKKLDNIFGQIDKKLRFFVSYADRSSDTMQESTEIVTEISNIYQFKKAIEQDVSKDDIYKRLAYIIKEKFMIENFTFVEIESDTLIARNVFQEGKLFMCDNKIFGEIERCRAKRTGNKVMSSDFHSICPSFSCGEDCDKEHICIPISMSGQIGIVINMVFESEEELEEKKGHIPYILNYANEAAPVLETKRLMQMLKESSLKDAMTGLYNRRFLDEYVEKLQPQILRQKSSVAIFMVDMDHFKMVNDTYGHDVGDTVLKELSKILADNVREGDLVVRYGGEEFIIIAHNIEDEENTISLAEKLRSKVEEKSIDIGNSKTLKKTISIGISLFPKDNNSIWQAIKYADLALYEAKTSGRNRVVRYYEELKEKSGY